MSVIIREVEINDYECIAALCNQLGYPTTNESTLYRLQEILNNTGSNCIYAAVDDDKVVGWIHGCYSLRVESDPFVEIGGLIIDKNYRRMGIGKVLVEKIVEWSASKQCAKVRVRSNVVRNEAHEFYKGIGFYESKEQKVFVKTLL